MRGNLDEALHVEFSTARFECAADLKLPQNIPTHTMQREGSAALRSGGVAIFSRAMLSKVRCDSPDWSKTLTTSSATCRACISAFRFLPKPRAVAAVAARLSAEDALLLVGCKTD